MAAAGIEDALGTGSAPVQLPGDVVDGMRAAGWHNAVGGGWSRWTPPTDIRRVQGWKIHVSATRFSADEVLRRCSAVLLESGTAFKHAATVDDLLGLNDSRAERGSSGKIMTVYPADDDELRRLCERLDAVTDGLAGPRILSDFRYRPGSLVHYRYGAFAGAAELTNDGQIRHCLVTPDGELIEDERSVRPFLPPWDADPFQREVAPISASGVPLRGRYQVTEAIQHANKGGVYRGVDLRTELPVVLKEGRPHVSTDTNGHDAADHIRHEYELLAELAADGLCPQPVELFEEQGHLFLVEEELTGSALSHHAVDRDSLVDPFTAEQVRQFGRRIAELVRAVHRRGIVLRDLSPNNIMVTESGELRLIDLEIAARVGDPRPHSPRAGTPGFSAPERLTGLPLMPSADVYSIGAVMLFLATGPVPEWDPDCRPVVADPRATPTHSAAESARTRNLRRPWGPADVPEQLATLIEDCMRDDPSARPGVDEVIARLSVELPAEQAGTPLPARPLRDRVTSSLGRLTDDEYGRLTDGLLGYVLGSASAAKEGRLWKSRGFGAGGDPCSVQHGAAGTLTVLGEILATQGNHSGRDLDSEAIRSVMRRAADSVVRHLDGMPHRSPGLHFGVSGIAVALDRTGILLGDPTLRDRARKVLHSRPARWPNPDIAHGSAGLGTAAMLLAATDPAGRAEASEGVSSDGEELDALLALTRDIAEGLAESCLDQERPLWRIEQDFDSALAGLESYGFAHGIAGIATFLLAGGLRFGRRDWVDLALRGADHLKAVVNVVDEAADWDEGPGRPGRMGHWCNGASGVGTFLVRAAVSSGRQDLLDLASASARTVLANRFRSGPSQCHGLAGDGEFLLDVWEATGDRAYLDGAEELARQLWFRRQEWKGLLVVPGDSSVYLSPEYGVGTSGALAFLHRLRHGGDRLFHLPLSAFRTRP